MDEVFVTMIAQYMKMQWLKSISNLGNEGIVKYRMKSKQLRWGVWSKKPLCRNYSQASIKMPLEAKGCKSSILGKKIFDKQKFWTCCLSDLSKQQQQVLLGLQGTDGGHVGHGGGDVVHDDGHVGHYWCCSVFAAIERKKIQDKRRRDWK